MDELNRLEAKSLARAKLRARRRRIRAIRVRSVAASLALFAVAWAIVFGQLVSGADPVLGRTGRSVASTHHGSPAKAGPEPTPEAEFAPEAEPEAEFEPEPEPEPEPVVTSAS